MHYRLGVAMMASSSTVVSRAADYAATSAGTAEAQCSRVCCAGSSGDVQWQRSAALEAIEALDPARSQHVSPLER
jgi:hypothetical protein